MSYTDPSQSLGGRQVFAPGRAHAPAGARAEADRGPEVAAKDESLWGEDGFGFDDFLDIVNPLQHLPIVGTVYREATGDQIAAGPRMIGGGIFGGVIGLAASLVDAAIESETGRDVGSHVMAWLGGEDAPAEEPEVMVAAATPETDPDAARRTAPATVHSEPLDPVAPAAAEPAVPSDDGPEQSLSEAQWQSLIGALTRVGGNPAEAAAVPVSPRPQPQPRLAMANPGEAPVEPIVVPAAAPPPAPAIGFPGAVSNEDFLSLMTANLEKYQAEKRDQLVVPGPATR